MQDLHVNVYKLVHLLNTQEIKMFMDQEELHLVELARIS